ncbi:MAG: NADAR family protein [Okeania sp. SIO2F4]|nr:NADAR family protein [Okeania sp. SIO2F4]
MQFSTDNELIIENSPSDYYWGCGKDGTGKNKLGLILMAVRQTLRVRVAVRSTIATLMNNMMSG